MTHTEPHSHNNAITVFFPLIAEMDLSRFENARLRWHLNPPA